MTGRGPEEASAERRAAPEGWRELLEYLQAARGFDFHGYKPTTLMRRIRKRMDQVGAADFSTYRDYLEVHPDEFAALFNTILINVTGFFRDPQAWEALAQTAIRDIVAGKPADAPIRVWSAGCATGEEAYSLAILLAEAMGADAFTRRVKIYATDVDEEALNQARHAAYTERQVEAVAPGLRDKYFERTDNLFFFRKDLRRLVIFGRHDLLHDAPISRIDLLVCRNVLMYFNAEAQAKILSRFHFALNEGGYLFLGRAETLMTQTQMFVPVDLRRRISRKAAADPRERSPLPAYGADLDAGSSGTWTGRLRDAALEASPLAQLVVSSEGLVTVINERARLLFGLTLGDLGRPLQDLQISYRPVELRSVIDQAGLERRPVSVKDVEWRTPAGENRWFDLQVAPLADASGTLLGTAITFTDVTAAKRLQRDLEQANQELETAYEELQSTNEELETTNEELQSTVEELETTNEELQSTNEELETMNEELQSTNEELQTINDELRDRSDELNSANAFLQSVLASLRSGVAVVDRELKVLAWNPYAEELWGLRADEVTGQYLLNLDIGLPLERVHPALRACLAGEDHQRVAVEAVNRKGHRIRCEVACSPLHGPQRDIRGVILLMQPAGE